MTAAGETWTDLADGIRVRQSRVFRMNSVVLFDPLDTVIVDPGVLPAELDDLAAVVRALAPRTVTLLFTHAHWDHVLGRPWWPDARSIAHDRFAAELLRERAAIDLDAGALAAEHGERWPQRFAPFRPEVAVSGLRFLPIGPWRLVLRDAPGHSDTQLTCHLADHRLLIAADMLSDIEPPILDGSCNVYRETLEALLPLAERGAIATVVPGHGAVARGRDAVLRRLHRDLDYLRALEDGVSVALASGRSLDETRVALAAMDYAGRGSSTTPTAAFHLENIAFAYRGLTTSRHESH